MATTRKQTRSRAPVLPQGDELGTAALVNDEDEQQEIDAVAELRGLGAGDEYKYTVARVASKPGDKQGYCATYNAGDLSLDSIRDQFGGGKYRIRVTDAQGKYVTNRTVDIVELPKAQAPAAAAATNGLDIDGTAKLLTALKGATGSGDGMSGVVPLIVAMMDNQMKSMQTMITAMMAREKGPSITELLALMKGNDSGNAVETLLRGLELGKTLGGGGGDTGMLDVAKEGLGVLSSIVAANKSAPAAVIPRPALPPRVALPQVPAQGAPPATAQPAVVAAPVQTAGEDAPMLEKLNWLKKQLGVLLVQAARGKSAELYAEVMLDNLPPFIKPEELLERLQQPDAVKQLAMLDGRVLQHAEWFEEFRQECVEFLTGEAETDGDTPGGAPLGDPQLQGDHDDDA